VKQYLLLIAFVVSLAVLPIWGARTGNGTSDALQKTAAHGLFSANLSTASNPQGSISFWLDLVAFPPSGGAPGPNCNTHCGEIVGIGNGHQSGAACNAGGGTCVDIFVCPTGTCGGGFANTIIQDMTSPGSAESETGWAITTGGWHNYVFNLNQVATSMKMYKDGVLISASATSSTCTSCAVNYQRTDLPITLLSSVGTDGTKYNFTNGIIADVAIWNSTISANEALSLANCVPPNRIQPDHVVYWPIYGTDSPEPSYTSQLGTTAAPVLVPFTLTGTTATHMQAGCPAGGAYQP
jgi:hypothetical protein